MNDHKKTVYISTAVQGIQALPSGFLWSISQEIIARGVDVLSEHVTASTKEESNAIFLRRTSVDISNHPKRKGILRAWDFKWVKSCDYFIIFYDGPSTGSGMELQKVLDRVDKPPVLALINNSNFAGSTAMVSGIGELQEMLSIPEFDGDWDRENTEVYPQLNISQYSSLEDAKSIIFQFLNT